MIAVAAPAALALLALGAAPVVLHWLTRRRARRIDFPALALIAAADHGRTRRARLRELAILALRTLAVLAVAAAAAQPMWHGLADAQRPAVIVLDASASMRQAEGGATAFARGVAAAGALADRLAPRPVHLVLSGNPPRTVAPTGADRRAALFEATCGNGDGDPAATLASAIRLMPEGGSVLWLTDLARSCLSGVDPAALPAGVALQLIDLGGGADNRAITAISCEPALVTAGRPFAVVARVANYGRTNARLRLRLTAGTTSSLHELELAPGASGEGRLPCTAASPGTLAIAAELVGNSDALPDDDRRSGALAISDGLRAVVCADGDRDSADAAARPMQAVLAAAGFAVATCDSSGLAEVLAQPGARPVVATVQVRDAAALRAPLAAHLTAGGTWLQVVTSDSDASLAELGPEPPIALGAAVDLSDQERGHTTISQANLDHPLLAAFTGREALLAAVRIQRYRLTPRPPAADAAVLFTLADGTIGAAERPVGAGRWLLWNGSPAALASDWAGSEALPLWLGRLPAWTVAARSGDLARDAVPASESDLRRLDPAVLGLSATDATQADSRLAATPLWPWLAMLALLALAGELWLAQRRP